MLPPARPCHRDTSPSSTSRNGPGCHGGGKYPPQPTALSLGTPCLGGSPAPRDPWGPGAEAGGAAITPSTPIFQASPPKIRGGSCPVPGVALGWRWVLCRAHPRGSQCHPSLSHQPWGGPSLMGGPRPCQVTMRCPHKGTAIRDAMPHGWGGTDPHPTSLSQAPVPPQRGGFGDGGVPHNPPWAAPHPRVPLHIGVPPTLGYTFTLGYPRSSLTLG